MIKKSLITACILIVALAWKLYLLAIGSIPFNADEAVVGLMARHILAGERPIFFYGQSYMGSLDAFLVAGGFWLFGSQVFVIRLIQAMLYVAVILTTIKLGKVLFNSWLSGIFASIILSIPMVNVTLYTTASLGGYGEALLLGNLILLLGYQILMSDQIKYRDYLLLGILVGLGLWTNGITLVYSLPVGIFLLLSMIKKNPSYLNERVRNKFKISYKWLILIGLILIGFIAGSLPWWLYAGQNGFNNLILELLGNAVAVEKGSWLGRTGAHVFSLILFGGTVIFGLRPPWEIRWLAFPLIPLIIMLWVGIIWFWIKQMRHDKETQLQHLLLFGVVIALFLGYIFTSFGVDPSGRYFLPIMIPLVLVSGRFIDVGINRPLIKGAALSLLIIFNVWGTLQSAWHNPPGITTQFDEVTVIDHRYDSDLIEFLTSQGEYYGYSNYWVSYPIAFLSDERIIYLPRLPYHPDLRYTKRDDRYEPYHSIVENSNRIAYITTNNPELDEQLKLEFMNQNVDWLEKIIGNYHIYYHLSKPIRPENMTHIYY